jgi:hypothetical protein
MPRSSWCPAARGVEDSAPATQRDSNSTVTDDPRVARTTCCPGGAATRGSGRAPRIGHVTGGSCLLSLRDRDNKKLSRPPEARSILRSSRTRAGAWFRWHRRATVRGRGRGRSFDVDPATRAGAERCNRRARARVQARGPPGSPGRIGARRPGGGGVFDATGTGAFRPGHPWRDRHDGEREPLHVWVSRFATAHSPRPRCRARRLDDRNARVCGTVRR